MYDTFSPEPELKDSAPDFYGKSASAILGVEQSSGKASATGAGVSAKGERTSQTTLAPKYTASAGPSARAKQRKHLVDKYVRQEIEPILATAMSYLLLKVRSQVTSEVRSEADDLRMLEKEIKHTAGVDLDIIIPNADINTNILSSQDPQDIRGALLTHFLEVQAGKGEEVKSAMISSVGGGIDPKASSKRKELLKKANSMVTELAKMVVIENPDDIIGFLVDKLQSWAEFQADDDNVDAADVSSDLSGLK